MSGEAAPARPPWLKVRAPSGKESRRVEEALRRRGLRTVCREARCPNVGECWGEGTATVLILGDTCTRGCAFCGVKRGAPSSPDPGEPGRVAAVAAELGWRHVVVTSVTRDDLPDGGAGQFAHVVEELRGRAPGATVELLVPDFGKNVESLRKVVEAEPDVLAHNVETVPRLYPLVRPGADYGRSLALLARAREFSPSLPLKSGLMLGFGETLEEVESVLRDLFGAGCRLVTMGQYLPPSADRPAPCRYISPEEFGSLGELARGIGFTCVASGPLVRSSYKAAAPFRDIP